MWKKKLAGGRIVSLLFVTCLLISGCGMGRGDKPHKDSEISSGTQPESESSTQTETSETEKPTESEEASDTESETETETDTDTGVALPIEVNGSQLIDVDIVEGGNTGRLTFYSKHNGKWQEILTTECYVGRNGIKPPSEKREGDGCTPSGLMELGLVFGIAPDPGSPLGYTRVNENLYWVDDSNSPYYNRLVDIRETGLAWNSAEHLIDYTKSYQYCVWIEHNTACVPDMGCAIFLHCINQGPTAGCVAIAEEHMITIIQMLREDARIYIHH